MLESSQVERTGMFILVVLYFLVNYNLKGLSFNTFPLVGWNLPYLGDHMMGNHEILYTQVIFTKIVACIFELTLQIS